MLLKKIDADYGKLYEVELDIEDVHTLEIWAQGSLSIIGNRCSSNKRDATQKRPMVTSAFLRFTDG